MSQGSQPVQPGVPAPTEVELPAPIPWLAQQGSVAPLDSPAPERKAADAERVGGCDSVRARGWSDIGEGAVRSTLVRALLQEEEAIRLRHPCAPLDPGAGVGAARSADRLLRAVHVLPVPDGVPGHVLGVGGSARAPAAARRRLPARRSVRRDDDLSQTHAVYRGLAWSLGILALTLVFGRVFCGWICPSGRCITSSDGSFRAAT